MLKKEVIEQLRSLKAHCESMKESGEEWEKDVQALEYAIKELERTAQVVSVQELERTAQEVPVQEQSTIYVNLDENFVKEVIISISKLNRLLNQKNATTTYQKI